MEHKFYTAPDKHIEGVGFFEIKICKNCGLKTSRSYVDGSNKTYSAEGTLFTKDPGCLNSDI